MVSSRMFQQYQQVLYSCQQCYACPALMDFALGVPAISGASGSLMGEK